MINKLTLSNFQGHKQSTLEFSPGVCAITGESDEGKTSIIRALKQLADNKLSGTGYISDFAKKGECSIEAETDGQIVERVLEFHTNKDGDKVLDRNSYWIGDQEFKALGRGGIPYEVQNILQLDELNFQNQMDAPFLLSASSGEVARYLNDIVNLNVIDESLKKINSKTNSTAREIETKESEIETNTNELKTLDWIDEAEKELKQLEIEQAEFTDKQYLNGQLADLLNDIDDLLEELDKFQDNDQELYDICLLIEETKNYLAQSEYLNSFKSDLNGLESISDQIDSLPFNEKEIKDIVDLSTFIDEYEDKEKNFSKLHNILNLISEFEEDIEVCIESIQTLETGFKNDFPEQCPLCGDMK